MPTAADTAVQDAPNAAPDAENVDRVFRTKPKQQQVKRTILQAAAAPTGVARRAFADVNRINNKNASSQDQKKPSDDAKIVESVTESESSETTAKRDSDEKPLVVTTALRSDAEQSTEAQAVTFSSSNRFLPDIDSNDLLDVLAAADYAADIAAYLKYYERTHPIRCDYLCAHTEVTGRMRAVLLDWLVQVHLKFHLCPETFYLTVAVLDRHLQENREQQKADLQLAGVAAMLVACKYEEMYPPELADFVDVSDNSFDREQLIATEMLLLRAVDFGVSRPLPIQFLRRYSKANKSDPETHTLAKYLLELVAVEYAFAHVLPSMQAAVALFTALSILNQQLVWPAIVEAHSGWRQSDLLQAANKLCRVLLKLRAGTAKQTAIFNKYTQKKQRGVADHDLLTTAHLHHIQQLIVDAQPHCT